MTIYGLYDSDHPSILLPVSWNITKEFDHAIFLGELLVPCLSLLLLQLSSQALEHSLLGQPHRLGQILLYIYRDVMGIQIMMHSQKADFSASEREQRLCTYFTKQALRVSYSLLDRPPFLPPFCHPART